MILPTTKQRLWNHAYRQAGADGQIKAETLELRFDRDGVFMFWYNVYMTCYTRIGGVDMPIPKTRSHKHFRLDAVKIRRAQKLLRAGTETETIERALDLVISEHEKNRLAAKANERFVKSGVVVKDVYGTLEP